MNPRWTYLHLPCDQHGCISFVTRLVNKLAEVLQHFVAGMRLVVDIRQADQSHQQNANGVTNAGVRKDAGHDRHEDENVWLQVLAVELLHAVVHRNEHLQGVHLVVHVRIVSLLPIQFAGLGLLLLLLHLLQLAHEIVQAQLELGDSVSGIALRFAKDPMENLIAAGSVHRLNEQRAETRFDITSLVR